MKTWFEELGYSTNPLSIKPSKSPLGNSATIESILERISQGQFCLVHGQFGSGKTTLLHHIINSFGGQRRVIYFACNRLDTDIDLDRLLYERFGLVTKLLKIKSKQMILLLDEADNLSEDDLKKIKLYYNKGYFQSVVLVTHKLDAMKIPQPVQMLLKNNTVELSNLKKEEIIQLVKKRIDHQLLSEDIIYSIYNYDKRVRSFLKNCEVFMRHMIEQKRKTAKVSDVKKILAKHKF